MDNQSTNQKLRLLIDTQCRSITYEDDATLHKDVESVTSEVKQVIRPEVVDTILEMNALLRRSTKLERLCDRKNPIVVISNLTNKNWSQKIQDWQDAEQIYEEKLKPLLEENHAAVWNLCTKKVWAEQNWYDWNVAEGGRLTGHAWDYMDRSLHGLIWADHFTNNLGFSPAPKISKNAAVKLVAYHKARLWTSEAVPSTRFKPGYGPSARGAAFEIAEQRAKELLDNKIVELVLDMQVKLRQMTHLNRRPEHYATTSNRGEDALAAAKHVKEKLGKIPGIKKADDIYEMCFWCAWHEQNSVDYDRCTIDKLTGEANGYKRQAAENKNKMDLYAYSMGFDEA